MKIIGRCVGRRIRRWGRVDLVVDMIKIHCLHARNFQRMNEDMKGITVPHTTIATSITFLSNLSPNAWFIPILRCLKLLLSFIKEQFIKNLQVGMHFCMVPWMWLSLKLKLNLFFFFDNSESSSFQMPSFIRNDDRKQGWTFLTFNHNELSYHKELLRSHNIKHSYTWSWKFSFFFCILINSVEVREWED